MECSDSIFQYVMIFVFCFPHLILGKILVCKAKLCLMLSIEGICGPHMLWVFRFGHLTLNNMALLYGHGAQLIHSQEPGAVPTDNTHWTPIM